jgi:hypothetical protein
MQEQWDRPTAIERFPSRAGAAGKRSCRFFDESSRDFKSARIEVLPGRCVGDDLGPPQREPTADEAAT